MTDDIRKAKIEAAERAAVEPILRALREDARMAVESIREKAIESACVEFTRGDMPSWRRWEEDERNETREAMARAIAAYERAM